MWFFLVAFLALVSFVTAGQHAQLEGRVHKGVARRAPAPSNETSALEKRGQFSGRWTFFDVGLGACGKWNTRNDYIVALNTAQYGYGSPGPQCFKMITMSYNGKTATAQIMDECPSCGYGELDLSRGLFDHFADESLGEIQGSWSWGSGGGGNSNPAPAPKPKPKTTTTKKEEPAYTPPAPKTIYTPPADPTTTKERAQVKPSSSSVSKVKPSSMTKSKASSTKSSSSAKSASSSISYNTGYAAGLATSVGSIAKNSTAATGSLIALNELFIQLGSLIVAGGAVQ